MFVFARGPTQASGFRTFEVCLDGDNWSHLYSLDAVSTLGSNQVWKLWGARVLRMQGDCGVPVRELFYRPGEESQRNEDGLEMVERGGRE